MAFEETILNEDLWPSLRRLYGKPQIFEKEPAKAKVTTMQSILNFGAPISHNGIRYLSSVDRRDEQERVIYKFQQQVMNIVKGMRLTFGESRRTFEASVYSD